MRVDDSFGVVGMMRWIFPGFLILWSAAGMAQECDDYGLITPNEADGYTGSELTFRISAANIPLCGDASTCVWELDGEPSIVGTIESEVLRRSGRRPQKSMTVAGTLFK